MSVSYQSMRRRSPLPLRRRKGKVPRSLNGGQKQGGQKTNVSAHLGQCLAILYLQTKYPGTIIRFNPLQNKYRPYDLEQVSKEKYLEAINDPFPDRFNLSRVWEVKAIRKSSSCFEIDPDAHKKLSRVKARHGKYYAFVLFMELSNELKYFPDSLRVSFSVQEVPMKIVSGLLRKAKYHRTYKKLSFRSIFHKEAYLKTASRKLPRI